ncbi:cellulase family glycosylhydrolase [Candidatus Microgenomates bacterium]|nr:cellulase family glycosylhydrolase [Candidatus Microgenomates bacterium]
MIKPARIIFVFVLASIFVALFVLPSAHLWQVPARAATQNGFITVSGKDFFLNGKIFKVKGSNFSAPYYNWPTYMNEIPNENAEKQFSEAKKFNINVIRLPTSYIGLGRDQVTEIERDKLRYYLNLATKNNFKLIISFFPDGPDFSEIKDPATHEFHKKHLSGIVPYFKDDSRIFAWEVANELLNPVANSPEDRLIMIAWAREMVGVIRSLDANHLVTVGGVAPWTFGDHPEFAEFIDFVPLHYYPDWPMNPPDFFEQMVTAMRNLGYNQPLLIEEFGYPTYPINEETYQKQKEFYTKVCEQVKGSNEVTGMINWSIQDANIDIYPHDDWYNQWGLIKSDFSWKPSAFVFRDCNIGQCSLKANGDANCDNRTDSEDFTLLVGDYLEESVHNTDFNSDGRVDSEDFAILQTNYQED